MVEVEWIDSSGADGWQGSDQPDELLSHFDCLATGYLVRDQPKGIVIALGWGPAGGGIYLSLMAIPREAIRKIHRLRR